MTEVFVAALLFDKRIIRLWKPAPEHKTRFREDVLSFGISVRATNSDSRLALVGDKVIVLSQE
jgi:hypothetical protein